jgi:hypothetical protein
LGVRPNEKTGLIPDLASPDAIAVGKQARCLGPFVGVMGVFRKQGRFANRPRDESADGYGGASLIDPQNFARPWSQGVVGHVDRRARPRGSTWGV